MDAIFIYDDMVEVPEAVAVVTGVECFGELLHKRRRLAERADDAAAQAGFRHRVRLSTPRDAKELLERLGSDWLGAPCVYLSADIVEAQAGTLAATLAKLAYAEVDMAAIPAGAPPGSMVAALRQPTLLRLLSSFRDRRTLLAEEQTLIEAIPCPAGLWAITDHAVFARFLSEAFDTRTFNSIRQDGRNIVKSSADRQKMKREHDYWYLLPPRLQRYLVQPYDYAEDAAGASYRMERLNVPDAAMQWIHGALSDVDLGHLLDAAFGWLADVPRRVVSKEEARQAAEEAYIAKLDRRLEQLMGMPAGQRVSDLLAQASPHGPLPRLVERLKDELHAAWRTDGLPHSLAIQHGDLCFSNILFDKRSRFVRFIDPKGATQESELWGDAGYDLAKLSHSILGGYDFLNNGLFDIVVGDGLMLEVKSARPAPGKCEALFIERVSQTGTSLRLLRLQEASLFLSMLPLHAAEGERKVLALALNGARVLDEATAPPQPSALRQLAGSLFG